MADLEGRVEKLEEKVRQLEIDINKSLSDIKASLSEIKTSLKENSNNGDLKNNLIEKDVKINSDRITKLEGIVSKITWGIVLEVLGLAGAAIIYYVKTGM